MTTSVQSQVFQNRLGWQGSLWNNKKVNNNVHESTDLGYVLEKLKSDGATTVIVDGRTSYDLSDIEKIKEERAFFDISEQRCLDQYKIPISEKKWTNYRPTQFKISPLEQEYEIHFIGKGDFNFDLNITPYVLIDTAINHKDAFVVAVHDRLAQLGLDMNKHGVKETVRDGIHIFRGLAFDQIFKRRIEFVGTCKHITEKDHKNA